MQKTLVQQTLLSINSILFGFLNVNAMTSGFDMDSFRNFQFLVALILVSV